MTKVIPMAMTLDGQRSSCKSKEECGDDCMGGVLRKSAIKVIFVY